MSTKVRWTERGEKGPRILLLPGLGARAAGLSTLAALLAEQARTVVVDYPEGAAAAVGPRSLAEEVAQAVGNADGAIVSSYGGLVGAHLAHAGVVRAGLAFVGSFARLEHLGWRGRAIRLMGPIATVGRPGWAAAIIASQMRVSAKDVADIVPTTRLERLTVRYRSRAAGSEASPATLRETHLACICIHGGRDVLIPAGIVSTVAADLPPGTPTHVIPQAGHVPYYSHPHRCCALLAPWVARLACQTDHELGEEHR